MDFLRCTIQDAPSARRRVSPAVTIDSNGHFADIIRKRFPAHRTSEAATEPTGPASSPGPPVSTSSMRNGKSETSRHDSRRDGP
ncbi:hypothetical protein BV898_11130 [Hypsibius exemplaris]|uniref:Uncharacterized protein n=1 Tax=Hypsibius exemplaris TaxID=2072580 RepID=A0A1W0WHE4_HYPEX|nr:hypothetical protein BV898_11130 [Hypsibius exemplaris]